MKAKIKTDTSYLQSLAIYLTGKLEGQGHLKPLGTFCLDNLWTAIKELHEYDRLLKYKAQKKLKS